MSRHSFHRSRLAVFQIRVCADAAFSNKGRRKAKNLMSDHKRMVPAVLEAVPQPIPTNIRPLPPARPAHLPALTGLRFVLALWVIVNHLVGKGHVYEPAAQFLPGPLQAVMRGGYLAVPTFFMLSGLVLARTYSAISWTRQTLWKYAVGRFARVYPVYLLSLLIVAPFIVKAQDQPKAWLVAMHLTLLQAWWVGHYTAGWNTPAWSLSCEMFFYLVFPVFVLRWKKLGWIATLATATLACALTKLLWAAGISDQLKPVIHLADFLMGIAIARALELITAQLALKAGRWPSGKWLYATGILGSALLIGYAQYLPDSLPLTILLRPMNALLLLGFALGGGWLARFLATRPLVYLGKASYSMYILHIPILWWAVSWPGTLVRNSYVAFVIVLSCIVFAGLEEPLNRYLRSLAGRKGPNGTTVP